MRVVFMGTPAFSVPVLRALATSHDVVAAYTRPDRPSGRGLKETFSPVKSASADLGIPVYQPRSFRDEQAVSELADLAPDVVCVAAYGLILPLPVLAVPPSGCLNVHASLLPRHRGAAPIEHAILAGDAETGVSIMLLDEGMDTGAYARQEAIPLGGLDATAVREKLAETGAHALLVVIGQIEAGTVAWTPQSDAQATYAPRLTAQDVALDPSLDADQAVRRVRASSRSLPSRAILDGRPVRLLAASRASADLPAGTVAFVGGSLLLGCRIGVLSVDKLVPAGRKEMSGAEFGRGLRPGPGTTWEGPS